MPLTLTILLTLLPHLHDETTSTPAILNLSALHLSESDVPNSPRWITNSSISQKQVAAPTLHASKEFFDTVFEVECRPAHPDDAKTQASSVLVVTQVLSGHESSIQPEQALTIQNAPPTHPGERFIAVAQHQHGRLAAMLASPSDESVVSYFRLAFDMETTDPNTRIDKAKLYFQQLAIDNPTVQTNCMRELLDLGIKEWTTTADSIPCEKVSERLFNKRTQRERAIQYGVMLGLCGDANAKLRLQSALLDNADSSNYGNIEGIVIAYVLISKEEGLTYLTNNVCRNTFEGPSSDVPVRLKHAVIKSAVFLHQSDWHSISKDKLAWCIQSFLKDTLVSDLAIQALREVCDWTLQEEVFALFDAEGQNQPVQQAVILYLLDAKHAYEVAEELNRPQGMTHGPKAREYLLKIESSNPNLYAKVLRSHMRHTKSK